MLTTRTLVDLSARLDQKLVASGVTLDFARKPNEDENSGLKTAGKIAGAGALVAGGLYARGRSATGWGTPNPRGVGATIAAGANALKGDARQVANTAGDLAATGGAKLNAAGRNLKAAAIRAQRSVKSKIPFRKSGA